MNITSVESVYPSSFIRYALSAFSFFPFLFAQHHIENNERRMSRDIRQTSEQQAARGMPASPSVSVRREERVARGHRSELITGFGDVAGWICRERLRGYLHRRSPMSKLRLLEAM